MKNVVYSAATNQNGIIIRYYVLHDGQCVARFVTQEEIDQFIKEQGENVRSFVSSSFGISTGISGFERSIWLIIDGGA